LVEDLHSNLVLLKGKLAVGLYGEEVYLHSNLVLLKDWLPLQPKSLLIYLHSNLVLLKGLDKILNGLIGLKFTF